MTNKFNQINLESDYGALYSRMMSGKLIILDGGTGTELERRGAEMSGAAWCGTASENHAELLMDIHSDYIRAGADIITANTYASSRLMLSNAGLEDKIEAINKIAIDAALGAKKRSKKSGVVVAGSLSHMIPITGGTDLERASTTPSKDTIKFALHELADILCKSKCQLILLEMMYHPDRIKLALNAALETSLPVWAGLSAREGKDGQLLSFYKLSDIDFDNVVDTVIGSGIDAIGVMHTPSNLISPALKAIKKKWSGPTFAYPDSGYFKMPNWVFEDVIDPNTLKTYAGSWIEEGVNAIGGCCGLSIDHIAAIASLKN